MTMEDEVLENSANSEVKAEIQEALLEETRSERKRTRLRKVKGCDIQRLWSEQSKIREEMAAGRPDVEGILQLEWQLKSFMVEMEEKHSNAEAVILDLVKELVRTAQEVESINCQGASVEERLEKLEAKMSKQDAFHLEGPEAPVSWCRRSPSEVASKASRREAATWSGFEAPGDFIHRAQEKLCQRPQAQRPQRASELDQRKLVETAVSKAVADAMSLCETELRGLNAELTQALEKAANLHQESCKQDFAQEVEKAMTKLNEVREAPASLQLRAIGDVSLQEPSPKAPSKRRPSHRMLGALACLGVVKTADDP